MTVPQLLTITIFCGFVVLAGRLLYSRWVTKRQTNRLKPLQDIFGGKIIRDSERYIYLLTTIHETEIRVGIRRIKDYDPQQLFLALFKSYPYTLSITEESAVTRHLEKWELLEDIETEDKSFNEKFCIRSKNKSEVQELLKKNENRLCIENIFDHGYSSFAVHENHLYVEKIFVEKEDLHLDKIRQVLECMQKWDKS